MFVLVSLRCSLIVQLTSNTHLDLERLVLFIPFYRTKTSTFLSPQHIVTCHGSTLLPQFLGMYRVTVDNEDTYILVMRNMFSHRLTVHRKYDLKVDQFHSLIIVYDFMNLLLSHNGEELMLQLEFSMLFKTISAK